MRLEGSVMTECSESHLLDYDSLDCHLEDGHAGPHKSFAVDGDVWWARDIIRRRNE